MVRYFKGYRKYLRVHGIIFVILNLVTIISVSMMLDKSKINCPHHQYLKIEKKSNKKFNSQINSKIKNYFSNKSKKKNHLIFT
jgi:hypothetical protein